jgi:hypothetical protein
MCQHRLHPTKTLIASAYAAHVARRAADYGVRIEGSVNIDMKAVNVLGGNKEWRHRVTGKAISADLPVIATNDTSMRSDWARCSPSVPVADDLSIPDFLKREPATISESPNSLLVAAE